MTPEYNNILKLFSAAIDAINPQSTFTTSEVYRRNNKTAQKIFEYVQPLTEQFLQVVLGTRSEDSFGITNFNAKTLNFPHRFLKGQQYANMSSSDQEQLVSIVAPCFYLGLLYHLFYFGHRSRSQEVHVQLDALASIWLPNTPVASIILRKYYKKENQGSARILFDYYFNRTLEPALAALGIGFWKRGKARVFLLNLFLTGALLGVEYDLQCEK